ncbi:hypothetical protein B0T19DRAFT_429778 [Cercophora scortea]|uniref:Uncharacterized protein n=1 Tax=Cercophora scortea TaxID=314031 RepID=A0AAE0I8E9_9PEZI|nr:hypothetical protein B0T19DRAFT_429778 [Cercophora scortea]
MHFFSQGRMLGLGLAWGEIPTWVSPALANSAEIRRGGRLPSKGGERGIRMSSCSWAPPKEGFSHGRKPWDLMASDAIFGIFATSVFQNLEGI